MTDRITSPSSRTTSMTELVRALRQRIENHRGSRLGYCYDNGDANLDEQAANAIESLTGEGDLGEPRASALEKEGWVLVPRVPTREMLDELHDNIAHDVQTGLYVGDDPSVDKYAEVSVLDQSSLAAAYSAMIEAALSLQASEARGSSTPSPSEDELREVIEVARRSVVDLRAEYPEAAPRWADCGCAGPNTQELADALAILHRTHTSGETELEAAGSGGMK